ncbi:MAG: YceI family protein [Magnetococcales bacterium]|nr:YceI family protein [Magnetococcales bacterium]
MKRLTLKSGWLTLALIMGMSLPTQGEADTFKLDPTHSFVDFSISHLGYSVLRGRFNDLSGHFELGVKNPSIQVTVKTASVDSNHAERDKHLRGDDFLDVKNHPEASFASTHIAETATGAQVQGNLTLHGVTKAVSFDAVKIGEGKDPWGGYRAGYKGDLVIKRSDYGISYNLGPAAQSMTLHLFIEGIRQ